MSAKKTFPILIVFAMLVGLFGFAIPVFAAASDIVATYSLPSGQVNAGDTFSVPVRLAVTSAQPVTGLQFNMSWDPAVLDLVSITKGDIFSTCSLAASDFLNAPTINHTAGTMINYSIAGLGIPTGSGCYNSGAGANGTGTTMATLNFRAIANGKSVQAISGVVFADPNSTAYASANYTFTGFTQYVGQAPKLAVQGISFQPNGGTPPGTIYNAVITVTNQGGSASDPDTMVVTATNATPASSNIAVPAIAAGASQQFTVALTMAAGQQNSLVSASIATFSTTISNTYSPVSDSGNTPIDATFGAFIKITPDSAINFGKLALGANTATGSINVQCNTNYEVDVTDSNATNWNMSEWTGAAFVASGKKLQDKASVQAAGNTAVTAPGGKLLTGAVAGQGANDAGQSFGLTYSQNLHYGDPLLPAGETYHLVLTWNGFVTA
jgi:hypothetical protein